MTYTFAQFDPRNLPAAAESNDKIFANPVYGIEVTVKALAERCIANIDPQHTQGRNDTAAIEEALNAELPAVGTTLATVRVDLDAIGSMAILTMRADGQDINETVQARVARIADADKSATAPWTPQELPTAEKPWRDSNALEIAALASAISDFKVSLEERVQKMIDWLKDGKIEHDYVRKVTRERADMIAAIENGAIQYHVVNCIAVVESTHRAATTVGYSLSPVVIAVNPAFKIKDGPTHRKVTICQYSMGYCDIKAALAELNEMEPGWGGSPTIGGSPQGASTTLTTEQIIEVVDRHVLFAFTI